MVTVHVMFIIHSRAVCSRIEVLRRCVIRGHLRPILVVRLPGLSVVRLRCGRRGCRGLYIDFAAFGLDDGLANLKQSMKSLKGVRGAHW